MESLIQKHIKAIETAATKQYLPYNLPLPVKEEMHKFLTDRDIQHAYQPYCGSCVFRMAVLVYRELNKR